MSSIAPNEQQAAATGPTETSTSDTQPKLGFKEQVLGQAKIIRGTLLNKPEEKEFGHKILDQSVPLDKEVITARGAAPTETGATKGATVE